MNAAAVALSVIREDVRAAQAYVVAPSEGMVKLDLMENPYSLPADLAQTLGERLSRVALNRYPPGDAYTVKAKLAASADLPANMAIMLGNGSDELIHLIIQACARPDAVIMAPVPTFSLYELSAHWNRCRFVGVPLQASFALDVPAFLHALHTHRPSVVFLADPNNPTGNHFDPDAIEAIVRAAPGLVVIDEAYLPFAKRTWLAKLTRWPNLAVMRTLSKLGLAGLRLGYVCADPAWIDQFNKVRPPFNVNALTISACELLLDHVAVLDQQAAAICEERERLVVALRALPGVIVYPTSANFICIRAPDAARLQLALLADHVLIKNISTSHVLLSQCLRITVGTPEQNAQCLASLERHLSHCDT